MKNYLLFTFALGVSSFSTYAAEMNSKQERSANKILNLIENALSRLTYDNNITPGISEGDIPKAKEYIKTLKNEKDLQKFLKIVGWILSKNKRKINIEEINDTHKYYRANIKNSKNKQYQIDIKIAKEEYKKLLNFSHEEFKNLMNDNKNIDSNKGESNELQNKKAPKRRSRAQRIEERQEKLKIQERPTIHQKFGSLSTIVEDPLEHMETESTASTISDEN